MRRGVWFVQPVTQTVSFFYIQTLHNDSSHIEDVHLLFCTHFMWGVLYLGVMNLEIVFLKMLRGCLYNL